MAIRRGEWVETPFAIEILSESESYEYVTEKIQDYFDADAKQVWYIALRQRRIYAYTSATELTDFKADMNISTTPLLSDFQFVTSDLFA